MDSGVDFIWFTDENSPWLCSKMPGMIVSMDCLRQVKTDYARASAADAFDFQQVIDGVCGHVQLGENEPDICQFWGDIAVSLGCFVSLRTPSFRTNWYHLMPSSTRRHHWSSASILRASVLDIILDMYCMPVDNSMLLALSLIYCVLLLQAILLSSVDIMLQTV